jgi:hypothetical protein
VLFTNLYYGDQIEEDEMGRRIHSTLERDEKSGKPEGKRPLGNTRHRWEDKANV